MATTGTAAPALLSSLTESLAAVAFSFSTAPEALLPPADGISLLDTKNELLLSYIQNLVFLIVLKIRNGAGETGTDLSKINAAAIKKLVELRVYSEKGVRPLEGRIKYQIDKVLRAADDSMRSAPKALNGKLKRTSTHNHGSEDESDNVDVSDAESTTEVVKPDDLSYRPNPAALLRKPDSTAEKPSSTSRKTATYKPPRITPTSMPQTGPSTQDSANPRKQRKSYLLDEYVSAELSSAPQAQPSIGSNSTILDRGRGSLSSRQRDKQRERTQYEETNLARLPGESKAEKRKARARGEGSRRNEYGGEDWTGLGDAGDRVANSVGRNKGGSKGILERRDKRRRDDTGDSRNGGPGIGDTFEKRRRIMEGRAEKKSRKGR